MVRSGAMTKGFGHPATAAINCRHPATSPWTVVRAISRSDVAGQGGGHFPVAKGKGARQTRPSARQPVSKSARQQASWRSPSFRKPSTLPSSFACFPVPTRRVAHRRVGGGPTRQRKPSVPALSGARGFPAAPSFHLPCPAPPWACPARSTRSLPGVRSGILSVSPAEYDR